ncbi:MAG: hypothetical protein V7765_21905, partial [Oleispira sp.]
ADKRFWLSPIIQDRDALKTYWGKDANGSCADLCIANIPDGASYEIDDYDGNESVVPPRQSW